VQGVTLQQMMGCTLAPPHEWVKWKRPGSSRKGAFGSVSIKCTLLDSQPMLVAVKTIDQLSAEEMERIHRHAVREWVQINYPGLVQVHGSFLERDANGHIHRLHIVMEPLVGRWAELSVAFYHARTPSNIFVVGPGDNVSVSWALQGVPRPLLKELWDSGLGTLKQLDRLGRYTRDLKANNFMVDLLAIADKYGDEHVCSSLLQQRRRLHEQLLEDIKALQDAACTDAGEDVLPSSSSAAAAAAEGTAIEGTIARAAGVRVFTAQRARR
jgi:hypothetical protein